MKLEIRDVESRAKNIVVLVDGGVVDESGVAVVVVFVAAGNVCGGVKGSCGVVGGGVEGSCEVVEGKVVGVAA